MYGNVWEWCWDWYGSHSSGAQTDPRGLTSGSYRVFRGCSDNYAIGCRVDILVNGGTLDAIGAPDALIRFTSRAQNPIPGNWYGIRILEGDVALRNCVVEYAVEGIRFEDPDTRFSSYTLENGTVPPTMQSDRQHIWAVRRRRFGRVPVANRR